MIILDIKDILSKVDHTLLSQVATWNDIKGLCDDGIKYGVASVCIAPSYVKLASKYVENRIKVCTVIGFPNGYSTSKAKLCEASEAIENGADELDVVINLGWVKDKKYNDLKKELCDIKNLCGGKILKVIIEICLLTEEEKIKMCEIVTDSGADYIKTSTGFSTGGATFEDIKLFKKYVGENVKIKAAGGISSIEDAEKFIALGASRLGTSRIVKIVKEREISK